TATSASTPRTAKRHTDTGISGPEKPATPASFTRRTICWRVGTATLSKSTPGWDTITTYRPACRPALRPVVKECRIMQPGNTENTGVPATSGYPVYVRGDLDPALSRWMWLVKWILAIPHYIVLFFLHIAYAI